jgi:hypothetical protein
METTMLSLDTYTVPTTVQNRQGLWHPGFKHGLRVFYYEKDIFATETAAAQCAEDMIAQVTKELNDSLGFGFENGPKKLNGPQCLEEQ